MLSSVYSFTAGVGFQLINQFFAANSLSVSDECLEPPSFLTAINKIYCSALDGLSDGNFFIALGLLSPLIEEVTTEVLFEKFIGRKLTEIVSRRFAPERAHSTAIRIGGAVFATFLFASLHALNHLSAKQCGGLGNRMKSLMLFGLISSAIRNVSDRSHHSLLFHMGNNFIPSIFLQRSGYRLVC